MNDLLRSKRQRQNFFAICGLVLLLHSIIVTNNSCWGCINRDHVNQQFFISTFQTYPLPTFLLVYFISISLILHPNQLSNLSWFDRKFYQQNHSRVVSSVLNWYLLFSTQKKMIIDYIVRVAVNCSINYILCMRYYVNLLIALRNNNNNDHNLI